MRKYRIIKRKAKKLFGLYEVDEYVIQDNELGHWLDIQVKRRWAYKTLEGALSALDQHVKPPQPEWEVIKEYTIP